MLYYKAIEKTYIYFTTYFQSLIIREGKIILLLESDLVSELTHPLAGHVEIGL